MEDDEDEQRMLSRFRQMTSNRKNQKLMARVQALTLPAGDETPKDGKYDLISNYVKLKIDPKISIFEYKVKFDPLVLSKENRLRIFRQFENELGHRPIYNGTGTLFLANVLPDRVTKLVGCNSFDTSERVTVQLEYYQKVRFDEDCDFVVALFLQLCDILGLEQLQKGFFNTKKRSPVRRHQSELWVHNGISSNVRAIDAGLGISMNVEHFFQRQKTFYNILEEMKSSPNYKEMFMKYAIGKFAVARFNNSFHRIIDVSWELTPASTFKYGSEERNYAQHYRIQYNFKINDLTQPMLLCEVMGKGQYRVPTIESSPGGMKLYPLIPESCSPGGVTDAKGMDKRQLLMDLTEYTIHSPVQRMHSLREFLATLNSNEDCVKLMKFWGCTIDKDFARMQGTVTPGPTLQFNDSVTIPNAPSDFSSFLQECGRCYKSVSFENVIWMNHLPPEGRLELKYFQIDIQKWLVLCDSHDLNIVKRMTSSYIKVAMNIGIRVNDPEIIEVDGKRERATPGEFHSAIAKNTKDDTQFIMVVLPKSNTEIYSAVKQLCLSKLGVASQIVQASKIRDECNIEGIVRSVVLQVNCKLGGSLWALKVPTVEALMFIGMDAYHDRRGRPSVFAFVASMNSECTSYYSKAFFQPHHQEVGLSLKPTLIRALLEYRKDNYKFPDRIIVFRDGITSHHFEQIHHYEAEAMLEAIKEVYTSQMPKFCFVAIKKRVLEHIFWMKEPSIIQNLPCGTVIDDTITRPNEKDFFIVSQSMNQGTVRATHCSILEDCGENNPELVQKFAHITAFMYYNWPSAVRQPAMCQYAHKLGSLVGNYLHRQPNFGMDDKLYYL